MDVCSCETKLLQITFALAMRSTDRLNQMIRHSACVHYIRYNDEKSVLAERQEREHGADNRKTTDSNSKLSQKYYN